MQDQVPGTLLGFRTFAHMEQVTESGLFSNEQIKHTYCGCGGGSFGSFGLESICSGSAVDLADFRTEGWDNDFLFDAVWVTRSGATFLSAKESDS